MILYKIWTAGNNLNFVKIANLGLPRIDEKFTKMD